MPAAGLLVALLLVASVAGTVALWYAIDRETADNQRMSRADAERAARQDVSSERDTDGGDDGAWGAETEERR